MKHTFAAALAAMLVFANQTAVAADTPPTPTSAPGVEVIGVDAAKALVGKAQFFDMRSAVNFGKGHVKGAVALPYDNKSDNAADFDAAKDKFNTAKLPADKSATLVFYSDGPSGWKSYKAAVQAAKMGYKNVKWMREGTTGWVAKGLVLE
ncbi:MAG: rhodanese-like domain-containing protein [Betaproteobacteria bacterium]|nr:rhodanese-like domain-containing protein [Betaproteobacteria bacterium]